MTIENKTPMSEPTRKINGMQFLRPSEILAIRSINKLLVHRRKLQFNPEIINHIKYITLAEIIPEDTFSKNSDRSSTINYLLSSLSKTGLVDKYGYHSDFPVYVRTSNKNFIGKKESVQSPYVYEFNPVKTNKVVKLLSQIDFSYLGKIERTIVAGIANHPNNNDWITVKDIVIESDAPVNKEVVAILNSARKNDVLNKMLIIDKVKHPNKQALVVCKLTDFGKTVIDVCVQVSALLDKDHEQETQTQSSAHQLEHEDA